MLLLTLLIHEASFELVSQILNIYIYLEIILNCLRVSKNNTKSPLNLPLRFTNAPQILKFPFPTVHMKRP